MKAFSLLRCLAACESNATTGAMVLRLREHSVLDVPVHDTATHDSIRQLHQALLPATSSGLVAVSVGVDADGQLIVRLRTSSVVGFAVVSDGSQQLLLCVDPKIPQARFLELAQLAGLLPPWTTGEATLAPSTSSAITSWILAAFADALGRLFSTGGIRGTHEQVSAVLQGRVRGRIDITRLVRQFALSRPSDIPCVFPSHVFDNVWNRRLKYALHVARQLAGLHMSESALQQRFSIYDARLAAVTLEKPKRFHRSSARLPRSLQHYATALMFADWIIDNCSLTGGVGAMRSVSVALDMDKVFESAFFRGIQAIEPSARGHLQRGRSFHAGGDNSPGCNTHTRSGVRCYRNRHQVEGCRIYCIRQLARTGLHRDRFRK
jgi:hypothetical protein